MSQTLIKQGYSQAKKLLAIQAIVILLVACLGLLRDFQTVLALLSGGVSVLLANGYFVYKVFAKSGAQANKQVVSAFYVGESIKIAISLSLLVLSFIALAGSEVYVLVGYIMSLILQWLAPAIVKTN
jgi:ATP synthase protein I